MKKIRFLIMTVLLILVFTGCERPAKPKKFDSSAQTEAVKKRKRTFMVVIENTTDVPCKVNLSVEDYEGYGTTSGWYYIAPGSSEEVKVKWTSTDTSSIDLKVGVDAQASGWSSGKFREDMPISASGTTIYIGASNSTYYKLLRIWK